ncbi:regulatory protein RecX [Paenibacillus sp. NPDC058071]|uniref:regulatory protein RecX n=1 Tax=Paenibacillus sp. NPDC058071 TaxID=3346326 RepID=UPI0036DC57CF
MEIRAVEQDKDDRKSYILYVYGEEEPVLTVHEDLLVRHRLLKGRVLTRSELDDIGAENERYRAYALAVAYLGMKARTRRQIEQYLQRKELEADSIQYVLERLETEHIVDDEEYAKQFAMQKIRYSQKGRLWIKQELQQRGVSKQAAAQAAESIDKESELDAALSAARKKWRTLKGEDYDRKRKLTAFLLRRGFPGSVAREAVQAAVRESEMTEDEEDDGQMLDN